MVAHAGGGLDLAELCIVAGKTCWVVFVDGLVMNADGSVVDALSIATKVRLLLQVACLHGADGCTFACYRR